MIVEAEVECKLIVDTGFSGCVYLPEDKISSWRLEFVSSAPISLADQSTAIVDVYEANLIWFGASVRVAALGGPDGCDSLLGMELLEGCRIELDRSNGEVRIERL